MKRNKIPEMKHCNFEKYNYGKSGKKQAILHALRKWANEWNKITERKHSKHDNVHKTMH